MKIISQLYRKLFARKCFFKLNVFLYRLALRGLGIYNYENMKVSGEEHFIQKYIQKYANKKTKYIVFDVGANKGEYSKLLLSRLFNAEIYTFEPHPTTFNKLKENLKSYKNAKNFNFAVSNIITKLKLFDYADKNGSEHASLNSEIFSTVHKSKIKSKNVNTTTIDVFVKEQKLDIIDFLKIDVEGHELEVLKGAKKMLETHKIFIIQFEFTQLNSTTKIFFKDFYDLLANSYRIYRLLPNNMIEIKFYEPTMTEIFGYQNYVAILRNI